MSNKDYFLAFFLVLTIVATLYFAFKSSCKRSERCLQMAPDLDCDKLLELGVKGPEVCLLQDWINLHTVEACISINGRFDQQTEARLFAMIGEPATSLRAIEHPQNPC